MGIILKGCSLRLVDLETTPSVLRVMGQFFLKETLLQAREMMLPFILPRRENFRRHWTQSFSIHRRRNQKGYRIDAIQMTWTRYKWHKKQIVSSVEANAETVFTDHPIAIIMSASIEGSSSVCFSLAWIFDALNRGHCAHASIHRPQTQNRTQQCAPHRRRVCGTILQYSMRVLNSFTPAIQVPYNT